MAPVQRGLYFSLRLVCHGLASAMLRIPLNEGN
jgi:hypothetical protein